MVRVYGLVFRLGLGVRFRFRLWVKFNVMICSYGLGFRVSVWVRI